MFVNELCFCLETYIYILNVSVWQRLPFQFSISSKILIIALEEIARLLWVAITEINIRENIAFIITQTFSFDVYLPY